jgi:hypothetical protein
MDMKELAEKLIEDIDNEQEKRDIQKIVRYLKNYYDECILQGFREEQAMEMVYEIQAKMIFMADE